ncbi:hypothetical protein HOP50_17g79540 [Chloropicon primus]|uniref:PPIase cyclophilin-type domain-containing protein n=1 Tax=Chloropicon primus TaxID=1764295 RepID=A0A5B8MXW8_9CHLO|nr:hypothetical protein A3770_17p79310 [Chloropicon primus]UPR04610.1 hypothetical protein HOP50_17g79540 [Chloropicon primus]|eukprot:QDZ25413.1 hypothetical protein A3770_17p79310 [Chloropicon primus]
MFLLGMTASAQKARADVEGAAELVAQAEGEEREVGAVQVTQRGGALRVYLEVEVDGESFGRVVVDLDCGGPAGVKKFVELATGELACMKLPNSLITGSKFDFITPGFISSSGPTATRLKATAMKCSELSGGESQERSKLEAELKEQSRSHKDEGGFWLSLRVREDADKVEAPSGKLVSRNGKLEVVADYPRADLMPLPPSGTSFAFTLGEADAKELEKLDQTNLIVGRVKDPSSIEVLKSIGSLPVNRNNEDNIGFRLGKAAGDGRAKVAERGFNRPFSTIRITSSGLV